MGLSAKTRRALRERDEATRKEVTARLLLAKQANDHEQHDLLELMLAEVNGHRWRWAGHRKSSCASLIGGFEELAVQAVKHSVDESLAHLIRLSASGNQDACNLLLLFSAKLARTLNNQAFAHPDRFREQARRETAWPVLKSPHPAFSFPGESKLPKTRNRLSRFFSQRMKSSETTVGWLLRTLEVGQGNLLTSRGPKARSKIDDPLGVLVLDILERIESVREFPLFVEYEDGSAEQYAVRIPKSDMANPVKLGTAIKVWAQRKYAPESMIDRFGYLVKSRGHQHSRKYSKLLDMLFEKAVSLFGGRVGAPKGRKSR